MSLVDLIANDLTTCALREDDGALSATYLPAEQGAAGTGFACFVRPGADTVQMLIEDAGQLDNRRLEVLALLSVLTSGIMTLTTISRGPARGDLLRLTTTGVAGDWVVVDTTPNAYGGVMLRLRQESITALAAPGVREVRG